MKNKYLTLVITLFNPRDFEIDYWTNFYKKYTNEINIHFIWDGENTKELNLINKNDIFYNKKNLGKFRTIYNHIKTGEVKTPYFKVVDPDDYISIEWIRKFKFPRKNNKILLTNSIRISQWMPLLQFEVEDYVWEKNLYKKVRFNTYGNNYTILPTGKIQDDTFFSGIRIDSEDDQLLGYIALVNGAVKKKVNKSFYLYVSNRGETINDNLLLQLRKTIPTWREVKKIQEKTKKGFGFEFVNILRYFYHKRKIYIKKNPNNTTEIKKINEEISILENINIKK